jgi:RND family efflux transporter MFP subunit
VTVDPMYADFDVDETTVTKIKRMILAGKFKVANTERVPVNMALGSEKDFANQGFLNFVDNKVDAGTGQLRVRGESPNKDRLLIPGNFCRIRLALGAPYDALMVPDRAVLSEQGSKYVLIVDKDNIVQQQPVDVGTLVDGLRVIDGGLRGSEKVIINGLQHVRPSVTVDPREGKKQNTEEEPIRKLRGEFLIDFTISFSLVCLLCASGSLWFILLTH